MLDKIRSSLQRSYEQEPLQSRLERIRFGILIGIIGSVCFLVSSSFINIISFPQLKIEMDWGFFLTQLVGITIAAIVAAIIAGWPAEHYVGVVGGGVALTAILMIINVVNAAGKTDNGQSVSKAIVSTLPMVGVAILLALAMRWVMVKFTRILQDGSAPSRRKQIAKLVGIVILVGLVPGIFSRFDFSAVQTLNTLTKRLNSAEAFKIENVSFPVDFADKVKARYGTPYTLAVHSSSLTLNALDATINFADGYSVTCLLPTSASQFLVIDFCQEGKTLTIKY